MSKLQVVGIASAALMLASQTALAAPFEFAGLYAGAHAGYIDTTAKVNSDSVSGNGLMGGLQAGYNFIDGSMMYGIETDISLRGGNPSGDCDYIKGGDCQFDFGPMGTFRGRAGFASGDFLLFATGGIAAGRFDMRSFDGKGSQVDELRTFGKFGWTAGAGFEYLLGDMMSFKLEYRYTQYREANFESFVARGESDIDVSTHSVIGGINWHF